MIKAVGTLAPGGLSVFMGRCAALRSAIHAVCQLPPEQRGIQCKCIRCPRFMLRISNPYKGGVRLDGNNRPVAEEESHGIGTQSIAAYCEKHGAFCEYRTADGWFTFPLVQP